MREEIVPYQIAKGMNILDTYLRTDEMGGTTSYGFESLKVSPLGKQFTNRPIIIGG